jgi:hypothetical protein
MTFDPAFSFGNHLPEQIDFSDNEEDMLIELKKTLEDHAKMINRKDTGQYEETEVLINQTFPGVTPQEKRSVFRKTINFGALPNAALKQVAHNLTNFATIIFTKIYGAATNPGVQGIPIPYSDTALVGNQIELSVTATNIEITTAINYSAFTSCYVVLEYFRA